MMPTVFKTGSQWAKQAAMFSISVPTFQRMLTRFIRLVDPILYDTYITDTAKQWTMGETYMMKQGFVKIPSARYATGVSFQQTNKPTRGAHAFWSPFYKLHGVKTEVSVLPMGLAIHCGASQPAGDSNATVVRHSLAFHRSQLRKFTDDLSMEVPDDGPLREEYPDQWAILLDKGYESLATELRAICPIKRAIMGDNLTPEEEQFNEDIVSERQVLDKFLGRLSSLWVIGADHFKWDRHLHSTIFRLCVSLTNAHILANPLEDQDREERRIQERCLRGQGEMMVRRRREAQARYQAKMRDSLNEIEDIEDEDNEMDEQEEQVHEL
ncbi:hypothetical protein Poli38472_010865 [Pythium oligandrum]|uniref:DDE Tnp4 domain-containing protein n=1 Tax=Pythium oligandrum TaxID=41045 RepID=A0A8K1FJH2_PYTOL|nr:hypothetical protein Poli38472_010865 [Pythium oligandrum]|eukprot:TMW61802.1 hypothetical protein Poli38472_010865 [Pythium oligandrum]